MSTRETVSKKRAGRQNDRKFLTAKKLWEQTHPDMLPPAERCDSVTVVLPALEEDESLGELLPHLRPYYNICIRADKGLANAVIGGVVASNTPTVVVMDADGTHSYWTVHQMVRLLDEGYDLVCGVRNSWESGLRGIASCEGNRFIRARLGIPLEDLTSGFFAARRDKLLELPDSVWTGYGEYYIELLARARKNGWHVGKVYTNYRPRIAGRSHTNLLWCLFTYFRRTLKAERIMFPGMRFNFKRKHSTATQQPIDEGVQQPIDGEVGRYVDEETQQPIDEETQQPIDEGVLQPIDEEVLQPTSDEDESLEAKQSTNEEVQQPVSSEVQQPTNEEVKQCIGEETMQPMNEETIQSIVKEDTTMNSYVAATSDGRLFAVSAHSIEDAQKQAPNLKVAPADEETLGLFSEEFEEAYRTGKPIQLEMEE